MLGVTFGSKHSYNDWGIWLEDTHINPPLPKRYIVDVPARNGLLDLTPELTPTIRFENRTLTFNFRVKAGDWSTLVSQIYGDVHGKTLDVVSDLDPNWHWHGCVTVDDFSSDERTGKLVITVDADPFKLSNTENSYTVNGDGTITCEVDRMEISPAFELTAPTTVIYGDSSYVLESTATVEKTLSGDIVSFADGTANLAVDLTADIEPVQDLHGYDHPWVGGAGKNLCPYPFQDGSSKTTNGITFTANADGSIKINGTATANAQFWIKNPYSLKAGTYTISGFPSTMPTGNNTYLRVYSATANFSISEYSIKKNERTGTLSQDVSDVWIWITISSGDTVNNVTIYPMLELGSTASSFEPYSNICPISGWDEVNVNVSGINVWDEEWEKGGISTADGQNTSTAGYYRSTNYIPVLPNAKYYFKFPVLMQVLEYGSSKNYLRNANPQNEVFTIPSDVYYVRFRNSSANTWTTYNHDISINYPSTDHDYHAYNGQTYTIDLDGTRYGGTLDVTTGVLTITHGFATFNGSESWSNVGGSYPQAFSLQTSINNALQDSIILQRRSSICNRYEWADQDVEQYGIRWQNASFGNGLLYVYDATYSSNLSGFKASLNSDNLQIRYELKTPQVVQLTAEQVMILKNQNNIWVDSGEVEVTYLAQDFAGKKFFIPDLELTEGNHELTIQGTGTTTVTYTNGRL